MTYDIENLLDDISGAAEDKTPSTSLTSPTPPTDAADLPHALCPIRQYSGYEGPVYRISHDLSDNLLQGEASVEDKLHKQLELLHALFQITANKVSGVRTRNNELPDTYFDSTYLDYSLRLQEQSVTTAKALSQISYMDYLRKDPHPPIPDEQKELGKNDS